ncbi:hypothetical protein [Desulfobulbus rhabdoformis]|nr:hypothetical protein [Desulfobulbus rhabdoformis]
MKKKKIEKQETFTKDRSKPARIRRQRKRLAIQERETACMLASAR